MSYYLSEAYSDLYNPRVDSSFDDNLRFIDFMQDEDIQEVVESVFWEICDYGSTLEEAYNILEEATSLEVINEAYQNILAEARVTYGRGGAGTAEGPTPNIERQQRQAARTARVTGAVKGIRKRIDGGISRVQAAMSGARGGMGRAAKALGSKASEMASSGKARLGQLLRRGVGAVKSAAGRSAGAIRSAYGNVRDELTGKTARQAQLKRDFRRNVRNADRRLQREKGVDVFQLGANRTSAPVPTPTSAPARSRGRVRSGATPLAPSGPSFRVSSGRMGPAETRGYGRVPSVAIPTPTPRPTPRGFDPSKPGSLGIRPYGKGKQVTSKGVPYRDLDPEKRAIAAGMQTPARLRRSVGTTQERVPTGTSGERGKGKRRGGALYGEKTMTLPSGRTVTRQVRLREENDLDIIFNQILEDLVYEGYTSSIDESFDFLNDLDDSELNELIESYLD